MTVNEVNVAPVVTNPGDQTDAEGTVVSLPIAATDADLSRQRVVVWGGRFATGLVHRSAFGSDFGDGGVWV